MTKLNEQWISLPVVCVCCDSKWVAVFDKTTTTKEKLRCPSCKQWARYLGYICTVVDINYLFAIEDALRWYENENLYDMNGYMTSAPLAEAGSHENVWRDGNPIMNDRGKTARFALEWRNI